MATAVLAATVLSAVGVASGVAPVSAELRLPAAPTWVTNTAKNLRVWALARVELVAPEVPQYLNRLSDLLFILARVANPAGDVMWVPGGDRAVHEKTVHEETVYEETVQEEAVHKKAGQERQA